jgi:heptaprenyl diphosphate synthase
MYGLGILRRGGPGSLRPGLAGIGTAGALCSTGVQLLLARYLVFGEAARYLIPPFLATALVTGFGLGLFCEHFRRRSRWYTLRTGGDLAAETSIPGPPEGSVRDPRRADLRAAGGVEQARQRRRDHWDSLFDRRELAIAGFLGVLIFLLNPSTPGRGGQFLFFWFCAWASGKRNRPLVTLLVIAGVVLVNLLAPYGRVLVEIGPLSVTTGSLAMGFRKGITLEGLFMLSAALIRGGTVERREKPEGGGAGLGALGRGFGVFRRLLEESLAFFTLLNEGRGLVRPGHFVEDLDSLFLDMEGLSPVENSHPNPGKAGSGSGRDGEGEKPSRRRGRLLLALGLLITALPAILPGFLKRMT